MENMGNWKEAHYTEGPGKAALQVADIPWFVALSPSESPVQPSYFSDSASVLLYSYSDSISVPFT